MTGIPKADWPGVNNKQLTARFWGATKKTGLYDYDWQYNLVPVVAQQCSVAGKVTVLKYTAM